MSDLAACLSSRRYTRWTSKAVAILTRLALLRPAFSRSLRIATLSPLSQTCVDPFYSLCLRILTYDAAPSQPRWSHFYAHGPEILKYLQGVAAKYKLERFLRYGHKLTSAVWNEDTAKWHLTFDLVDEKGNKTGAKEVDVDVVIQGMGGLSRWDWPNIPGLQDFKVRANRLSLCA